MVLSSKLSVLLPSSVMYFWLLSVTITDLLHVVRTQQVTPIIGGKCDINAADIPIGGKQTQFFLKCEQSLQSESGKGVWVVKSRSASATTPATLQTSPSLPPTTVAADLPTVDYNLQIQQQPQQFQKPDSSICVQDKSAREADPCTVTPLCLQQDQQQSSNYLQCDQSNSRWVKKSCLDGQTFSFEHQSCITPSAGSALKQSRLGTLTTAKRHRRSGCKSSKDCKDPTICINRKCIPEWYRSNGNETQGAHHQHHHRRRPCNGHPRCLDGQCGPRMKCFGGCCALTSCPSDLPPLMFVHCSHHRDCPEQMFCFGSFCCPRSDQEKKSLLGDRRLEYSASEYLVTEAGVQRSRNLDDRKILPTTVPTSGQNESLSLKQYSASLISFPNEASAPNFAAHSVVPENVALISFPEASFVSQKNTTVPEIPVTSTETVIRINSVNPSVFSAATASPLLTRNPDNSTKKPAPSHEFFINPTTKWPNSSSKSFGSFLHDNNKNYSSEYEHRYLVNKKGSNRITNERNDSKHGIQVDNTVTMKNSSKMPLLSLKAHNDSESLLQLMDIFRELLLNLHCNSTELNTILDIWLQRNLTSSGKIIRNPEEIEKDAKIYPSQENIILEDSLAGIKLAYGILNPEYNSKLNFSTFGRNQARASLIHATNTSTASTISYRKNIPEETDEPATTASVNSGKETTFGWTTTNRPSWPVSRTFVETTTKTQQSEAFSSNASNFNFTLRKQEGYSGRNPDLKVQDSFSSTNLQTVPVRSNETGNDGRQKSGYFSKSVSVEGLRDSDGFEGMGSTELSNNMIILKDSGRNNIWQEGCTVDQNCLQLGFCPDGYTCRTDGYCCVSNILCPNDVSPSSECFGRNCMSSGEICLKTADDLNFCCPSDDEGFGILSEESTLDYNYSDDIYHVIRSGKHGDSGVDGIRRRRQHAPLGPGSVAGIVCTFMQCSQNNPCQQGTCNNGYCCISPMGHGILNQPFATPVMQHQQPLLINQPPIPAPNQMQPAYNPAIISVCANGGAPAGACLNMRCARGYVCSPGNVCCPSSRTTGQTASTADPLKNPFVCSDGTQAVGACILGQCGASFSCVNGLCCNKTTNTPRCLDGTPAVGACLQGQCGAGFVCTTGNLCCSWSSLTSATCPNGGTTIGDCINGLCPTGYTCLNGQCCPSGGDSKFRCSNQAYAIGPCVDSRCPDAGFGCDTSSNQCCPRNDPAGPCVEGVCPTGYKCFTNWCYKVCDGRGTKSGDPVNDVCPAGTSKIFGDCCTTSMRFYNAKATSFLSERHSDYLWPSARSIGVGPCPDGSGAVSACINGICGHNYQCYNNLCCPTPSGSMMLSFAPATLRPIGGPCEFTQQCASSMEGLSICELGTCRCLPGTYVNGFVCVRRFNMLLNDATGSSSLNGTSVNDVSAEATAVEGEN